MHKILVVGSLHYDIMIKLPHSLETGETVIGTDCTYKFGGKGGNQAVSLAKSNVCVRFVGAVGNDANSHFLLSTLNSNEVDTKFVQILPNVPSGLSVALIDTESDYSAVVIPNANALIDLDTFNSHEVWEGVSLLVLQNEIPEQVNLAAVQEAKKRGVKVCLNAAPAKELSDEFKKYVDLLVVNAIEARDMSGVNVNGLDSAATAASLLNSAFPTVVVTVGEHGVVFSDKLTLRHGALPSEKVKLVSTHGAGDCFMGTLCAALACDVPLQDAVQKANKAAAVHVSTPQV